MTNLKSTVGAVVFGALLSACAAQQLTYDAHPRFTRPEAQALVTRVFDEQPRGQRPLDVTFTQDAMKLEVVGFRSDVMTEATAAVREMETYYFSNLADPVLFHKRSTWRVLLANREGLVKRWVIFTNDERAKEFIDAIVSLRTK